MKLLNRLFKKPNAPKWDQLSDNQRRTIARKIVALAGPQYHIVSGGFDESQRRGLVTETKNEDGILDVYRRGRMLDGVRNAARNSATFQTILKQFDFQAVGTQGGKVILNFDDSNLAHELRDRFADYTRSADFFDGVSFNQLLKLILKTSLIGGDMVIAFDDGLIEDSGKLVCFESDEIGNTTEAALISHYGKNAHQSLGKVYSANGRFIGAIVSRSQRGETTFAPDKCFFLKRDPDESWFNSHWLMPSNFWRIAQGRGISQAASAIGTITDLEDLCGYELQAAKKNAQTFAQIIHTDSANEERAALPSAFDSDTDFANMSDAELEAAVKAEAETHKEKTISFSNARSCGIVYEQMPDEYKMELLNTAHPNENIQDFVKWLCGRSSAALGLSEAYATLMPTGADFRAQQLLTQPAFIEAQKYLEQIADWVFFRFVSRLVRKGEIDGAKLPARFMDGVSWAWPQLDEIDQAAHQSAVEMRLRNLTGSLQDELGSDWQEKLLQIKKEIDFCKANGLPHAALGMISGGMREEYYTNDNTKS